MCTQSSMMQFSWIADPSAAKKGQTQKPHTMGMRRGEHHLQHSLCVPLAPVLLLAWRNLFSFGGSWGLVTAGVSGLHPAPLAGFRELQDTDALPADADAGPASQTLGPREEKMYTPHPGAVAAQPSEAFLFLRVHGRAGGGQQRVEDC